MEATKEYKNLWKPMVRLLSSYRSFRGCLLMDLLKATDAGNGPWD